MAGHTSSQAADTRLPPVPEMITIHESISTAKTWRRAVHYPRLFFTSFNKTFHQIPNKNREDRRSFQM